MYIRKGRFVSLSQEWRWSGQVYPHTLSDSEFLGSSPVIRPTYMQGCPSGSPHIIPELECWGQGETIQFLLYVMIHLFSVTEILCLLSG